MRPAHIGASAHSKSQKSLSPLWRSASFPPSAEGRGPPVHRTTWALRGLTRAERNRAPAGAFPIRNLPVELEVNMSLSLKVVGSALCAGTLLMAPAAYGQTLEACGQTVAYRVEPPAPQVPPQMQAFSGPWIGAWDAGVCNAIVIESIQPDGTVRILDVFGPVGTNPPGQLRYAGKIAGNTLTSSGPTQSVQFTLNGQHQMSGTFISNSAQSRGSFSRP
jgi:hypothetical protein